MSEELDFSTICRVCCLQGNMISIFKVHISKKLMACSAIQVWPNDNLPSQICSKCVAILHIAFQFKKLCEKSDGRLRNYLANIQNNDSQDQPTIEHNNLPVQEIQQQNTEHTEPQNNYIYLDCGANIEHVHQDPRHYEIHPNNIHSTQILNHHPHTEIAYSNTIQQIPGTYPIQSLHIPSALQYQTYNVPIQLAPPNHILTLGTISSVPTTHTLQPIINNQNMTNTNLQSVSNFMKHNDSEKNRVKIETEKKNLYSNKNTSKLDKRIGSSKTSCRICGKEFNSPTQLSRHLKIHSGELPYKCTLCHKGFSHSGNFKVHMRMHTDERPYQCRMCDKACKQQQDLEKHMRTHTGEKPHGCKTCGRAFSTSSNLIAHKRIHSGEKPYVCSFCQKGFSQSNELTKHARTHTGEKSHICEICNKGFNGSSTLIVHMRSHTGERPYVCNICQKGFTQSSSLQIHLKRHKGEKYIQCNICVQTFMTNADLKKHQLTHDNDKLFGCTVCDKRYSKVNDLNKHIKTHSI